MPASSPLSELAAEVKKVERLRAGLLTSFLNGNKQRVERTTRELSAAKTQAKTFGILKFAAFGVGPAATLAAATALTALVLPGVLVASITLVVGLVGGFVTVPLSQQFRRRQAEWNTKVKVLTPARTEEVRTQSNNDVTQEVNRLVATLQVPGTGKPEYLGDLTHRLLTDYVEAGTLLAASVKGAIRTGGIDSSRVPNLTYHVRGIEESQWSSGVIESVEDLLSELRATPEILNSRGNPDITRPQAPRFASDALMSTPPSQGFSGVAITPTSTSGDIGI